MRQNILSSVVLSLPFLSAFALTEKVSLTLFIGIFYSLVNLNRLKFLTADIFFLFFILGLIISATINIDFDNSALLYISSFIIVYLVFYKGFQKINHDRFIYFLNISFYVSSIYILYEFVAMNFFPQYFFEAPRINVSDKKFLINKQFFRCRGFAEEPGHMGMFYEFAIPILIPFWNNYKTFWKVLLFIFVMIILFTLGSSFTIALFSLATLCYVVFSLKNNPKLFLIILLLLMIFALIIIFSPEFRDSIVGVIESILKKVILDDTNFSVSDRSKKLKASLEGIIQNSIFGIGPMNFKEYSGFSSSLNLYLDIYLYSGFFGFISFITFIMYKLFPISRKRINIVIALVFILLHCLITANFWFPYLWILLALLNNNSLKFNESTTSYK